MAAVSESSNTSEFEELLNNIKSTAAEDATVDTICSGLYELMRLYKCLDDLLTSSTTRVLMLSQQNKKWVGEFADESVKCLDICGSISSMLTEIKCHSRGILCALRRRKGELRLKSSILKYSCFRKKMKKDVKGLVGSLKQVRNNIKGCGGSVVLDPDNHRFPAVIRMVIGVFEVTLLVFESLLLFFCVQPASKRNRWSTVVSKLMHKGVVACEDQEENESGKFGFFSETRNVQTSDCRLERLEARIESLEGGLECVFRCLVQTRVSLLNIISM